MNKCFLILPFIALLLVSCEQEENVKPVKDKSIRFSFSGNNELLRQASSATPVAIKATIRDAAGNVLVQRRTLNLHKFGEQYLSVPLTLPALENASYQLSEFFVVNAENEVIYVTPREGSELAHLVNDPLDIAFVIDRDEITTVTPEVLAVDADPEDYGYGRFGFDLVNSINIVMSCFVKAESNFELTSAHVKVEGLTAETGNADVEWVYEIDALAQANIISLRKSNAYRITATKQGYDTWTQTLLWKDGDKLEAILAHHADWDLEQIWTKHYGGSYTEHVYKTIATDDGGAILFCSSNSDDYDATGWLGDIYDGRSSDYWIVKLSAGGSIEWKKRYGDQRTNAPNSAVAYPDGSGYFISGRTPVFSNVYGAYIMSGWLMKINNQGDIVWDKKLTETFDDVVIANTGSNNFLLASSSLESRGAPFTLMQVDGIGNQVWRKQYPSSTLPSVLRKSIYSTAEGYTVVTPRGITAFTNQGEVQFDKMFSTQFDSYNPYLVETQDGYLFFGDRYRNDQNLRDIVVKKTDKQGNEQWERSLIGNWIGATINGGTVLSSGNILLTCNGGVSDPRYYSSIGFIMELSPEGVLRGEKAVPNMPTHYSGYKSIICTTDNAILLTGNGSVSSHIGTFGYQDIIATKIRLNY